MKPNKTLGQKNGKSQATIPGSLIPHLLKGLTRLSKVCFIHYQIASCKTLLPRFQSLALKTVSEHRVRMSADEALTLRDALTLQAEWLRGGQDEIPANFACAAAYFYNFAKGVVGESIPKDPETAAPVEVIDAGVEAVPIADVVAANLEG